MSVLTAKITSSQSRAHHPTDKDTYSMSPGKSSKQKNLTDSESDEEAAIMNTICSRTPTKPTPLDMKVRKDRLGLYMSGKQLLAEDLALSSDSSEDDLEDAARQIETMIS
jgi:hypothetical protein